MELSIEEQIRELFRQSRDCIFDSTEMESRLPNVLAQIDRSDRGNVKKIVKDFANSGWQGKTIRINLPDLPDYPVAITSQFGNHMKERVVQQMGTMDEVKTIAKMMAVVIAKIDDIAMRGEKRGWGESKHQDRPGRSLETWVYVQDTISYAGLGSFRVILEVRKIPTEKERPISLYSGNVDRSSTWGETKKHCDLTMVYENKAMKVKCDIS